MNITGCFPQSVAKRHLQITLGKMLQPNRLGVRDELLRYIRAANIFWGYIDYKETKEMWFSADEKRQYALQPGDLVVLEGGDVGRSAICTDTFGFMGFQNSVHRVRPITHPDNRFTLYWLEHLKHIGYFELVCNKATLPHLTLEKLSNAPYPAICPDIARSLADFLDSETSRIDQLIEKKQRLVELLDEKRNALIAVAVTGEIDPDSACSHQVSLRGVEVETKPIKRLFQVSRKVFDPRFFGDSIVYLYSLPEWHESGTGSLRSAPDIQSGKLLVQGGEILVSKLNPEKGAVIHSKSHEVPTLCSTEFIVLKSMSMWPRFAFYLMCSEKIRSLLQSTVESVTNSHKRARVERFLSSDVQVVPQDLQKAVAEFLDLKTSEIDTLKSKTHTSISRLHELRSALVTAAVTGQINVKTWRKSGETDRSLDRIEETSET